MEGVDEEEVKTYCPLRKNWCREECMWLMRNSDGTFVCAATALAFNREGRFDIVNSLDIEFPIKKTY